MLAENRLSDAKRRCGGGQATVLDDLREVIQIIQIVRQNWLR
jgi:hypothetical protein